MASLDDGQEATAGGVVEHDIEREPGGSSRERLVADDAAIGPTGGHDVCSCRLAAAVERGVC